MNAHTDNATGVLSVDVDPHWLNGSTPHKQFTAWLVQDGENIGMIHYMSDGDAADSVSTLGDIEIREDKRGNGYALAFVRLLEKQVAGGVLYTTGHYTPEGYAALAAHIPLLPHRADYGEVAKVCYRSMNFVNDWENRWAL